MPCLGAAGGQLDGCVCSTFPGYPCWLGLLQGGAVGGCRQLRQCSVGCSMGWRSPTVLRSQSWDHAGCAQGCPHQQHRQLKSWGAFPGHCRGVGRAAGAPLAAEAAGLGQSIHPGMQSPAGHRAGAQEPVNTTQKFPLKVWDDLWVITGCDRVSCQAWLIWGWGIREDNGDKLGPKGMCAGREGGGGGGQGRCRLLLHSQTQPALIIRSHHRR